VNRARSQLQGRCRPNEPTNEERVIRRQSDEVANVQDLILAHSTGYEKLQPQFIYMMSVHNV